MITSKNKIFLAALCACLLTLLLTACKSEAPEQPAAESAPGTVKEQSARYQASIRRTSYGVAHIEAANLESLGFGEGYTQAEDHLCTIADQIVKVRSERAASLSRPYPSKLAHTLTFSAGIFQRTCHIGTPETPGPASYQNIAGGPTPGVVPRRQVSVGVL